MELSLKRGGREEKSIGRTRQILSKYVKNSHKEVRVALRCKVQKSEQRTDGRKHFAAMLTVKRAMDSRAERGLPSRAVPRLQVNRGEGSFRTCSALPQMGKSPLHPGQPSPGCPANQEMLSPSADVASDDSVLNTCLSVTPFLTESQRRP